MVPNTYVLLIYSIFLSSCFGSLVHINEEWKTMCPDIYLKIFIGYAPMGNDSAGIYSKGEYNVDLEQCLLDCCNQDHCHVVFMYDSICYQISCNSSELCAPLLRPEPKFHKHVQMILVSPVPPAVSWEQFLDIPEGEEEDYEIGDTMELAESRRLVDGIGSRICEVGVLLCPIHETCVAVSRHSRNGQCQCNEGYERNSSGVCTATSNAEQVKTAMPTSTPGPLKTSEQPLKQLVVSAVSKEVRLPENEVTLSAYTVPAEGPDEHYKYEWTLVSHPDESNGGSGGTMTDQNGGTLKLSHLTEGLYTFKVIVSAPGAYGETFANVSVLPPKRINQVPVAIISPSSQTVKLPNTGAVLDGSSSHDDDTIIGWHWELQKGPLGYQPHLIDTSTLQLDNLTPGNYTFKLTVEDSDHATNFTTANITVLKVTDYPPEANAGQDVIIYLPRNNLTLNGNLSTDDKGIASWEWTKGPSDQNKAVDMQNTRTPYLQLSNLEEGMYTFLLKVTDDSGQTSSSEVHVFVKPPTSNPPVANAGDDINVWLPQTWALLNGTNSTDDGHIVSWYWEQLSGPSKVQFDNSNNSVTNVTLLTRGKYEMKLTVVDDGDNKASDTVIINVNQNKNARPKANGGGDQTVELPVSVVVLNGSRSTDDLGITSWLWTREPNSLAFGKIVGSSNLSPVLLLTDVVPGRYVFKLRVMDEQDLYDEDTVSVIVKQDPHLLNLIQLALNIESQMFTQSQQDSLQKKLSLLLGDDSDIHVQGLHEEDHTGRVVVTFFVNNKDSQVALPGPVVVSRLKEKLTHDSGLLDLSISSIQTSVCQNNCSGHGVCDQATRQCLCEAFWIQDLIAKYFGDGESDCNWSILYVVIFLFTAFVFSVACVWGMLCVCRRMCIIRPRKKQRYSLLNDGEADVRHLVPHEKVMLSESDSDSDVLFENQKSKMNGNIRNGHGKLRNGFTKIGRRIKA